MPDPEQLLQSALTAPLRKKPPDAASVRSDAALALSSEEVFPPDPPVAVLSGALSVGSPSYDAVVAEHVPLARGGESCRSCGFVYTDRRVCPALILAADPDHRAVCELTVAVERIGARLDVIGARIAPAPARWRWARPATPRRSRG